MPKTNKPSAEDKQLLTAHAEFEKLKPRFDTILVSEAELPRIDLQAAAVQALGVARVLNEPSVHRTIVAIAKTDVLDLERVDGLEPVAWATWYARHKFLLSTATHTDAVLPAPLVEQSITVRGRMLKTLVYQLEDDADAMAEITNIRAGSGHLDLANDLASVAGMYRKHEAAVKHDRKNYRATDVADAERFSEQILRLLGATTTPDQEMWKGYCARAAKLLFAHYEEAIRVGRFLWHHDDPEGRFPSLHSATRSTPVRTAKKGNGEPEEAKDGEVNKGGEPGKGGEASKGGTG